MLYQPWLITLNYLRQHRTLASDETADDTLLGTFIQEASQDFSAAIVRTPHPYVATRLFDYQDPYTVRLDEDLLSLTTLTNGDAAVISSTSYVLKSANEYPKWRVVMKSNTGTALTYSLTPEEAISIAGIWGYVPHYPTCWKTLSATAEVLDTSETGVDVTTGQGALFEVGHYLLIDDEQMFITAISTDTLTVERGVNGTTAAAHLTSAAVKVFKGLNDIMGAVRDLAAYYYKTKDQAGARVQVFDGGAVQVQELDPRIQKTIDRHMRRTIMGVG